VFVVFACLRPGNLLSAGDTGDLAPVPLAPHGRLYCVP
jgi:hypothetical protein